MMKTKLKATAENDMPAPKAKPRMTLGEKVYHSLYTRIGSGEYPTNHKLPSENALAQEFGVSRPILRSALDRLRDEGMIYSRQGAGSFVRIPVDAPVGYARVETLADIQRCYEFRLTLECHAASLAAERHNAVALADIKRALDLLHEATGSLQHREDADFAFHFAIAKAAHNHYFEATLRALREHIYVGMKLHGQSLMQNAEKNLSEVLAEHDSIYDAIAKHRPQEAAQLMRGHLERSRDRLFGGGLIDLRMPTK